MADGRLWGRIGGGVDVRAGTHAAIRIGVMDTFKKYERVFIGVRSPRSMLNDVSMQVGLVYR